MRNADAVVILTEWNQFRNLDVKRMAVLLRKPVMVDLRNIYTPADMAAAGFSYTCIGRPSCEEVAPGKTQTESTVSRVA
jgi:UDPglucose 6-dehydrogenase